MNLLSQNEIDARPPRKRPMPHTGYSKIVTLRAAARIEKPSVLIWVVALQRAVQ